MQEDASETRYSTLDAISPGVACRPSGTIRLTSSSYAPRPPMKSTAGSSNGGSTQPGQMVFDVNGGDRALGTPNTPRTRDTPQTGDARLSDIGAGTVRVPRGYIPLPADSQDSEGFDKLIDDPAGPRPRGPCLDALPTRAVPGGYLGGRMAGMPEEAVDVVTVMNRLSPRA
ncbi:hypothetical protein GCM10009608_50500 [Pseudonocardia alaniniphila]